MKKKELVDLKTQTENLNNDINIKKEELVNLPKQIENLNDDIGEANKKLELSKEMKSKKMEEQTTETENLKTVTSQIEELKLSKKKKSEELNELKEQIKNLGDDIVEAKEELQDKSNTNYQTNIDNIQTRYEEKIHQIKSQQNKNFETINTSLYPLLKDEDKTELEALMENQKSEFTTSKKLIEKLKENHSTSNRYNKSLIFSIFSF
jgi:predicted  nucleic acid-binding Zn-ribbon protein